MAKIVIKANPTSALEVELCGIDYKVKPPKMAVLAVVAKAAAAQDDSDEAAAKVVVHLENLIKLMFNKSAKDVLARLEDPTDELDYQQIMDTAQAVIEASTGNPTS